MFGQKLHRKSFIKIFCEPLGVLYASNNGALESYLFDSISDWIIERSTVSNARHASITYHIEAEIPTLQF